MLVARSGNKVTLSETVRRAGKAFGRRRTAVGWAPPSEHEQLSVTTVFDGIPAAVFYGPLSTIVRTTVSSVQK